MDTTDDLLASLLSDTSPVGEQPSTNPPHYPSQFSTVASSQQTSRPLDFSNPADFGLDPSLQDNTFFDDTYFGNDNYFLSDLEVLGPLGATGGGTISSDSSPEPNSAVDLNGHTIFTSQDGSRRSSSAMAPRASSSASSAELSLPLSNSRTSSISAAAQSTSTGTDDRVENFLDNLNYLKSPMPTSTANGTPLDTVAEEVDSTPDPSKRQRGLLGDFLTACWTSPLCPKNKKEGTPPDPSNCGGACAPYLFGDQPLPDTIDTALLPQDPEVRQSVEPILGRPRPNLKRSESDSSGAVGRIIPSTEGSPKTTGVKTEKTSSPELLAPEDNDDEQDGKATKGQKRLPHNQVERKYRESLNTQLESLRRVVPALQQNRAPPCDSADIEDLPAPSKPSKAVVLASATAYIKQVEKERKQLVDENATLRTRIKALQSLVK